MRKEKGVRRGGGEEEVEGEEEQEEGGGIGEGRTEMNAELLERGGVRQGFSVHCSAQCALWKGG